jgi:hypothetical protein
MENPAAVRDGIWLVHSLAGPLAYSNSFFGALQRAYEISANTRSFWEAPQASSHSA